MVHICEICEKSFKRIYELDRHRIRKYKCLPKIKDVQESISITPSIPPINTKMLQINQIVPPIDPPNISELINNENNNIDDSEVHNCSNCQKTFTRPDNLKRHLLFRCKKYDNPIKDDNISEKILKTLNSMNDKLVKSENKIETLQNTITDLQSKIRSEPTTTNNITNNNNTINITNNNNNNIVYKFGTKIDHSLITTEKLVHFLNHITS